MMMYKAGVNLNYIEMQDPPGLASLFTTFAIAEQELSAALQHNLQPILSYQLLEPRQGRPGSHQVAAFGPGPQPRETGVVEEDIRSARRVRSVHQVVHAAVQQQRVAIGVVEDRRKSVILIVDHQFSWRRGVQSLG